MEVCLTWDYELYFGENTGTVESCMLRPTDELLRISAVNKARMTFFIDVSFLRALQKYSPQFPVLQTSFEKISAQLQRIVSEGHTCELHIHSHWEDSVFDGTKWNLNVKRYRIQQFSAAEINEQIQKGSALLKAITGVAPRVYRAGGYCVQPFDVLRGPLLQNGIQVDSSVFPGGKSPEGTSQFFDFTSVKVQDEYSFFSDPCMPSDGDFTEIPIASRFYHPLFYWKLYILGKLLPKQHKGIGDGQALSSKGFRKQQLTQGGVFPVSSDGYYASELNSFCRQAEREGRRKVVIIGHPKASTKYSTQKLETFLKERYSFVPIL